MARIGERGEAEHGVNIVMLCFLVFHSMFTGLAEGQKQMEKHEASKMEGLVEE